MEFKTIKERYIDLMVEKICVIKEDLTDTEKKLIEVGYELFSEKLEDIKILNDELQRVSLELANLKSYNDNTNYDYDYDDDNGDED